MIGANQHLPGAPTLGARPAAGDRSTRIPDTAWVGGEIGPSFTFGVGAGETRHLLRGTMASAVPAAFDVLYLYLFELREALTIEEATIRVDTGQAGTAFKAVIAAHDPATRRPAAVPVLRQNTAIVTTSSGWPSATVSPAVTIPAGYVWLGGVFGDTGGAATRPTVKGPGGGLTWLDGLLGGSTDSDVVTSSITTSTIGISTPWAYANDLATLNLSGAVWSRVIAAGGIPSLVVRTA